MTCRHGLLGILLIAVLSSAVVACSAKASGTLELTEANRGSTQQLAIGQRVQIVLESNQTTGYRWAVDGDVPPQLEQVGAPVYSSGSRLVGTGGQEAWTFKGITTGTGELKLKYWRSFEPTAEPVETFSVTVDVK